MMVTKFLKKQISRMYNLVYLIFLTKYLYNITSIAKLKYELSLILE